MIYTKEFIEKYISIKKADGSDSSIELRDYESAFLDFVENNQLKLFIYERKTYKINPLKYITDTLKEFEKFKLR